MVVCTSNLHREIIALDGVLNPVCLSINFKILQNDNNIVYIYPQYNHCGFQKSRSIKMDFGKLTNLYFTDGDKLFYFLTYNLCVTYKESF